MSSTILENKSKHNCPISLKDGQEKLVSGGIDCHYTIYQPKHAPFGLVFCQVEPIILSDLS